MTQSQSCIAAADIITDAVGLPVCEIDRQMVRIARELRDLAVAIQNGDWSLGGNVADSGNIHDHANSSTSPLSDPRD